MTSHITERLPPGGYPIAVKYISYRPNQGDRHETLVHRNAVRYVTI
jgi:hypothetical protein